MIESFCLAILSTLVKQLGQQTITMILDALDGKGPAVVEELHQIGMSIVADLQLNVSTTWMRAQILAMESAVDATVDVAEEAKLAAEGQK